jgi:hypothetical protein
LAQGLSALIGDAFFAMLDFTWPDIRPRVERIIEQAGEVLRPDPPFTLQTSDGQVVTGFVVLDRGRALLFIGIRQFPSSSPNPAYRPPDRPYEGRHYDEPGLWPRPYGS